MLLSQVCSSIVLLLSTCAAAPLVERQWDGIRVPIPSSDPWYFDNSVCDMASLKPGDVIAQRKVEIPGFLDDHVSSAWQIKFRTTDSRSRPTWAITTLYIPKNRDSLALVSYQHFTDSADIDKSPSYVVIHHSDNTNWEYTVGALARKWYVNLPDYEGPGASFGAGLMAGHATLDSIRAVKRTGLVDDVPVGMWGYSGGALATEWAAELQGSYAPELKITVAVIGGLTPNTTHVFETTSRPGSSHADLIPKAVRGLAVQYPAVKPELVAATNLTSWEEAVESLTMASRDSAAQFVQLRTIINSLLGTCRVKEILSIEGLMGNDGNVPRMPIILHHALHDQLAPFEDVRKLNDHYCSLSRDVKISFRINNATTGVPGGANMHLNEGISGALWATSTWLPDAFAGKLPTSCTEYSV